MENMIRLIGYGWCKAIPARDLKPGMITIWNYGYKAEVINIEFSKTGKTLIATIIENGKTFERKMKSDRLVAVTKESLNMLNEKTEKEQDVQVEEQTATTLEQEELTVLSQATQEQTEQAQDNSIEVSYALNAEMNGIEITFSEKPSQEIIEQLKAHGFRWSKRGFWYAKQTEERLQFAKQLTGKKVTDEHQTGNGQDNSQTITTYSYPEIDIDDIHLYTVDERLQKAEHDASWIFRTKEIDRTKEIQTILKQYNDKVKAIIEQTDNERIIYYLKKDLQRFKKKYYENYIARLKNRADCPSWAVTGRAGRNTRRDQKMNNRYDNLMRESIELCKQMDNAIWKAENAIRKDKEEKLKQTLEKIDPVIEFKIETKEVTVCGYTEKVRTYNHGDYTIAKTWGCYRIFKNGKEIHSMKTTQKLDDAKKYVAWLVQQENSITA
jgi:hypothetical protein